jgi:segregation and condensation protein B
MAFNLKKVLKALLLSSSQPLSIKEVQAAFTRFHDTAATLPVGEGEASVGDAKADSPPAAATEVPPAPQAVAEPGEVPEVFVESPQDPEL